MAEDRDQVHVAALLRKRQALIEGGADQAKLNETDLQLRAAGIDPDKVEEPKAKEPVPERHEPVRHTAEETKATPKRGPGRPRTKS